MDILLASLSESTFKQYNSILKEWWAFSQENNFDPFDTSPTKVLEFLAEKVKKGAAYGTINSARAAISLISSKDLSNNMHISRFLKGVFQNKAQ